VLVGFNQEVSNFEVFGIMNVMYDGITMALIIIIPQIGINEPKVLSGMFNPKAIGMATITATKARLE
jgi:hypothetical protein